VYLVVVIFSVKGARNATFFVVGNIGRDWANDMRLLCERGRGPLVKIDDTLYGNLYGISADSDSIVEMEVADADDEDVKSAESVELGSSVRNGVGLLVVSAGTFVDRGVRLGRLAPGVLSLAGVL
jgi:hypothetical protein